MLRNSFKYVNYNDLKKFSADFKAVYNAPNEDAALSELDAIREKWGKKQNGIYIFAWQECERRFAGAVYLITVKNHSDEIEKMLVDNQIPQSRIRKCDIAKLFPNMI